MHLFEAILEANHRALAGESAGLHPAEFAEELPIIALTCIDPRLNPLMPEVLGVPEEQFIWLRNAGNIITGPLSSTMRSLALACAVKGGKEIAIIGHTDCQVGRMTTMQLIERFGQLGIRRDHLPDNVNEFFGTFASERSNVIKAADIVRHSPLIGPRIPVHGLLVDIGTGSLEWLVNGYQQLEFTGTRVNEPARSAGQPDDDSQRLPAGSNLSELKFPEAKIGELAGKGGDWLSRKLQDIHSKVAQTSPPPERSSNVPPGIPPAVPKIPLPPPVRPNPRLRKTQR